MKTIKTIYKIRAQIPAVVVEQSGLLSNGRNIGLNLAVDDAGNVEGAWDSSLLTLATVLKTLQEAGVQEHLIQRRVIALTVGVEISKTTELIECLRKFSVSDVSQAEDLFSGERLLSCIVTCEQAETLLVAIRELGVSKVIATEAYVAV